MAPTLNQYLLSYGPLVGTLLTPIIDLALTTNTNSRSPLSQQGAANFYKALRTYYPAAITLASAWSSGFLTFTQLTDGTFNNISDFINKASADPVSVIVTAPVITTGVGVGLYGINIGARIFTEAATTSQSSLTTIKANRVFDVLDTSVFPQLSGGLLLGVVGGAVAGGVSLLLKDVSVVTKPLISAAEGALGINPGLLDTFNTLGTITEPQVTALRNLITGGKIDEIQKIPTASITAIAGLQAPQINAIAGLGTGQINAIAGLQAPQINAIAGLGTTQITELQKITAAQLTAIGSISATSITKVLVPLSGISPGTLNGVFGAGTFPA